MLTTEDLARLQQALALSELTGGDTGKGGESQQSEDFLRFLVARSGHVKLQMYAERGPHKRPHFHIEFKQQYRASYAIDTLERIVGYMPHRYEEPLLDWARSIQPQLKVCWERISAGHEPLNLELEGADTP
jgi:hypothetical protein